MLQIIYLISFFSAAALMTLPFILPRNKPLLPWPQAFAARLALFFLGILASSTIAACVQKLASH